MSLAKKEGSKVVEAPKERKSRAVPKGIKTVLLYIPNETHKLAKIHAAYGETTLNDFIVGLIKDVVDAPK